MLAHQIKEQVASRTITEIRTDSGQTTMDPKEINYTFKTFYTKLYTSESPGDISFIEAFFEKLKVPTISVSHKDLLDKPITTSEVEQARQSMQSSKAPGPDGYTSELYKAFKTQVSPLILDVLNEALIKGHLPPTFYLENISLIHKKYEDLLDPGSYRPVSLLNVDYKMLVKLLAARLEGILPTVISQDQTGFIKDRQLFFNIRRILNIIYTQSVTVNILTY